MMMWEKFFRKMLYNEFMLDDKWKLFVKQTVYKYLPAGCKAFVFGSWATGTNQKYSDLDIGIIGDGKVLQGAILEYIKEDFEKSDFPYRVDVVNFSNLSKRFQAVASQAKIDL